MNSTLWVYLLIVGRQWAPPYATVGFEAIAHSYLFLMTGDGTLHPWKQRTGLKSHAEMLQCNKRRNKSDGSTDQGSIIQGDDLAL